MRALRPMRWLALALLAGAAHAQDAELDALKLADQTVDQPAAKTGPVRAFIEGAAGAFTPANPDAASPGSLARLSLDLQLDISPTEGLRFVLADRLDLSAQQRPSAQRSVNTLKEAYLSWQSSPDSFLDAGRINVRNGVAMGYNPTDYFRDGALRSQTSVDPASLRLNRMGTVLLRGQTLWSTGSLAAMVSPRLSQTPHDGVFSPDFAATNNRTRWQLALSQRLAEGLTPQFLLYSHRPGDLRLGANLSTLVNDATVAYAEWSLGRTRTQLAQALGKDEASRVRQQLATGLTYTAPNKLSLTLEYDYNGFGLDRAAWNRLRTVAGRDHGLYRRWTGTAQELPTRQRLFAMATWQDVAMNRLDWSVMLRHTVEDRSRLVWTELRYRWDTADLALQWQRYLGGATSDFGAAPARQILQLVARQYF